MFKTLKITKFGCIFPPFFSKNKQKNKQTNKQKNTQSEQNWVLFWLQILSILIVVYSWSLRATQHFFSWPNGDFYHLWQDQCYDMSKGGVYSVQKWCANLGNGQKPDVIARGAPQLISKAGIAAPESRRSYCILIHTQTNSSPLLSTTERRTVSEYYILLPIISENKYPSH